jgi:integral membrane sensor domain MASE1
MRCAALYLILTIAYVASGKLGLMLALPPGYISPIFPAAGIAVAAALIGGRRMLPSIFLGSLLLNVYVGYATGHQINTIGLVVASFIAIASTLQAAIGGWSLRRMIGYPLALDQGVVLRVYQLKQRVMA